MTAQQAMRTAWQIRKAAAAKFGVKVSEIMFAPCLKMAWAGETTMTREQSITQCAAVAKVANFNPSKGVNRLYITLKGVNPKWTGDNAKLYYDRVTDQVVFVKTTRNQSPAFQASLATFIAEIGIDIKS